MAINSLSYQQNFGNGDKKTSSPIIPALLVGGGTAAAVRNFGPKAEMTQDVFEKSVKSGATIKYTSELTEAEKKAVDSLKGLTESAEKTAAEGTKKTADVTEKELKKIFGEKETLTPNQYIQKRYSLKSNAIDALADKIKKAEAETRIKKDGPTLASAVKDAQGNVKNASEFQAGIEKLEQLQKDFMAAKQAKKSTTAIQNRIETQIAKLTKIMGEEGKVKFDTEVASATKKRATEVADGIAERAKKAKKPLTDDAYSKLVEDLSSKYKNQKTIEIAKKRSKTMAKDTAKTLEEATKALEEHKSLLERMQSDMQLVKNAAKEAKEATKAAGKGAKEIKPRISRESVNNIVTKIKEADITKNLASAFEAVKGKLPKVKTAMPKAALFGLGAAAATFIIGKMIGGSSDKTA